MTTNLHIHRENVRLAPMGMKLTAYGRSVFRKGRQVLVEEAKTAPNWGNLTKFKVKPVCATPASRDATGHHPWTNSRPFATPEMLALRRKLEMKV